MSRRPEERLILVDKHGHDLPVDDVGQLIPACDDVDLIPVIRFDQRHQASGSPMDPIARGRFPHRLNHAAAPRHFAPRRAPVFDVPGHLAVVVDANPGPYSVHFGSDGIRRAAVPSTSRSGALTSGCSLPASTKLRYTIPLWMSSSSFTSSLSSKSAGSPPAQMMCVEPTRRSVVEVAVIAPFSTDHASGLPVQPLSVRPSKMVQPVRSA